MSMTLSNSRRIEVWRMWKNPSPNISYCTDEDWSGTKSHIEKCLCRKKRLCGLCDRLGGDTRTLFLREKMTIANIFFAFTLHISSQHVNWRPCHKLSLNLFCFLAQVIRARSLSGQNFDWCFTIFETFPFQKSVVSLQVFFSVADNSSKFQQFWGRIDESKSHKKSSWWQN